jgi:hypothetical protein
MFFSSVLSPGKSGTGSHSLPPDRKSNTVGYPFGGLLCLHGTLASRAPLVNSTSSSDVKTVMNSTNYYCNKPSSDRERPEAAGQLRSSRQEPGPGGPEAVRSAGSSERGEAHNSVGAAVGCGAPPHVDGALHW